MGSISEELPAVPRSTSSPSDSPRPRRSSTARSPQRAATVSDMSAGGAMTQDGAPYNPTYDEIAEAAYHRYLRRGASHGQDFDDWVEAERELRSRRAN